MPKSRKPEVPEVALELVVEPQEYFRDLLVAAMDREKVRVIPETEVYLIHLLKKFMLTEALYARDEKGALKDEPLAYLLKDALEATQPEVQVSRFRQIGDVSLYTAGFFQTSLTRKNVAVDYYIEMGGSAYCRVSDRSEDETGRRLFRELSEKFPKFVDVLANVGTQAHFQSEQNLLKLYELWTETRSDRVAKQLREAGLKPEEATVDSAWKRRWQ